MDPYLSYARLEVALNGVSGLDTVEAYEGMSTWEERVHGLLQELLFVLLQLWLNVVVIFVLSRNKAASVTVLGDDQHVKILQVAHLDLNLENFVERWDYLHSENWAASILFQKSFKQGL